MEVVLVVIIVGQVSLLYFIFRCFNSLASVAGLEMLVRSIPCISLENPDSSGLTLTTTLAL